MISGTPMTVNRTTDGYQMSHTRIVGEWSHSVVVMQNGNALSWGCGADGRLGVGSYSDRKRMYRIVFFEGEKSVQTKCADKDASKCVTIFFLAC